MNLSTLYEYSRFANMAYVPWDNANTANPAAMRDAANEAKRVPLSLGAQIFSPQGWTVPSFQPNDSAGFAANVFSNGSEKVLAIRGTETEGTQLFRDLLVADVAEIGLIGVALDQAVGLFNYIQRLIADSDDHDVSQVTLHSETTFDGLPPVVPSGTAYISRTIGLQVTHFWLTAVENGNGLGQLGDTDDVTVTGHSLGGHLAAFALRLFPDLFARGVTFNAAGFDPPTSDGLTEEATFQLFAPHLATPPAATFSELSPRLFWVNSEDSAPGDDVSGVSSILTGAPAVAITLSRTESNSHSMDQLMDGLAVTSLIEALNPSMSFDEIFALYDAVSNHTAGTEEIFLQALSRVFLSNDSVPTNDDELLVVEAGLIDHGDFARRSAIHDRILDIRDAVGANVELQSLIGESSANLLLAAQSSIAHRYALLELNPFVILGAAAGSTDQLYAPLNVAGRLDLENLSDEFLEDRAQFLERLILRNAGDSIGAPAIAPNRSVHFADLSSGIGIDAVVPSLFPIEQRIFGSDGADALLGMTGDDRLYGGGGKDVLVGGEGADRLEGNDDIDFLYGVDASTYLDDGASDALLGGEGLDRYIPGQGDVILDDDGEGKVFFLGSVLDGGHRETMEGVHASLDGKFTYGLDGDTLTVTEVASSQSITIPSFANGNLGISLTETAGPPVINTLTGTSDDDVILHVFGYDRVEGLGGNDIIRVDSDIPPELNVGTVIEIYTGITIDGGDGNDQIKLDLEDGRGYPPTPGPGGTVFGGLGDDGVEGGLKDDTLDGGAGHDSMDGRAGRDILLGDVGNDFLDGGDDADILSGEADRDFLAGGGADDFLLGGAEGDELYGDAHEEALVWDGANTVIQTFIEWHIGGTFGVLRESVAGGSDLLDGGAGNDFIFAGAGDDFLQGGTDADRLEGEGGHDALFGGPGADILWGDINPATFLIDQAVISSGFGIFDGLPWTIQRRIHQDPIDVAGDDTLDGGIGTDVLRGGRGSDKYLFGVGHSTDIVLDESGAKDVVELGPGIAPESMTLEVVGDHLILDFPSTTEVPDRLVLESWRDPAHRIEAIEFADGTLWGQDTIASMLDVPSMDGDGERLTIDALVVGTSGDNLLAGTSGHDLIIAHGGADQVQGDDGDDQILGDDGSDLLLGDGGSDVLFGQEGGDELQGGPGDDALEGGRGDDILFGEAGNDTLNGGPGSDRIEGGAGSDVYRFARGDGIDLLIDAGGASDVVRLGEGIGEADLFFKLAGGDLNLRLTADGVPTGDGLTLIGFESSADGIEALELADGTILDRASILASIDELVVEAGAVIGGAGATRFVVPSTLDDGFTITIADAGGHDRLRFVRTALDIPPELGPAFLTPSLAGFTREGDDLVLNVRVVSDLAAPTAGGEVRITNYFTAVGFIESIEFPDGTLNEPNRAPRLLHPPSDIRADVDTPFTVTLRPDIFAEDPFDLITLSATLADGSGLPPWLAFDASTASIGGTPTKDDIAQLALVVTATDSRALATDAAFTLTVGNPPLLAIPTPDQVARVGQAYALTLSPDAFIDADVGDPLAFTASRADGETLPDWLSFDPTSRTFSGTPDSRDTDAFEITLTVTDGNGLIGTDTFLMGVIDTTEPVDLIIGSSGNDVLEGDGGPDVIFGGPGTDELFGLEGNDLLEGGPNDDLLLGGPGNDTLLGRHGNDHIQGDAGGDLLAGHAGDDELFGSAGEDQLMGGAGDDSLDGGFGNDRLGDSDGDERYFYFAPNGGHDSITDTDGTDAVSLINLDALGFDADEMTVLRDTGDDLILVLNPSSSVSIENWFASRSNQIELFSLFPDGPDHPAPTILTATEIEALAMPVGVDVPLGAAFGTESPEFLPGTVGDDALLGFGGDDSLFGFAGNDLLVGGKGDDVLFGQAGDDSYFFAPGDGMDFINDVAGANRLRFEVDLAATNVRHVLPESNGPGRIALAVGYAGTDRVAFDLLTLGADGAIETSVSAIGAQTVFQFAGGVTLKLPQLRDLTSMLGTPFDDVLVGTDAGEALAGGAGNDALYGAPGDDELAGDDGDDRIQSGAGADSATGGEGNDIVIGDSGDDVLEGGPGDDTLIGGAGSDVLRGGTGSDYLVGGAGDDRFEGSPGDTFYEFSSQDDGLDTIEEEGGFDRLQISGVASLDQLRVIRSGVDLAIVRGEGVSIAPPQSPSLSSASPRATTTGESSSITIQGWFAGPANQIEEIFLPSFDGGEGATLTSSALEALATHNQAPIVETPIADQLVVKDSAFSLSLPNDTFSDPDPSDELTLAATRADGAPLPAWLTFDAATQTLSGTPAAGDVGTVETRITAKDDAGEAASDVFNISIADQRLEGGSGRQTLSGGDGRDILIGGAGNDVLRGGKGDDIFVVEGTQAGLDRFEGGDGFDQILGGAGSDVIGLRRHFGPVNSVELIDGGDGTNVLQGSRRAQTIDLSATQLLNISLIDAGAGADTVMGTSGADVIVGGAGNDVLAGGMGPDMLEGGSGNDTYRYGLGDGLDSIHDRRGRGDAVSFAADISHQQLWFWREDDDLRLGVRNTLDWLTVEGWFAEGPGPIEAFVSGSESLMLRERQVLQLVDAMAAFDVETAGHLEVSQNFVDDASGAITAAWQPSTWPAAPSL